MKSMRSFVRLGANHSHSRRYGADLQRRMANEGAISCNRFGGTDDQGCPLTVHVVNAVDVVTTTFEVDRYRHDKLPRSY